MFLKVKEGGRRSGHRDVIWKRLVFIADFKDAGHEPRNMGSIPEDSGNGKKMDSPLEPQKYNATLPTPDFCQITS